MAIRTFMMPETPVADTTNAKYTSSLRDHCFRSRHDEKGLARMWKKANKRCDVRDKTFRLWPYHHPHRVTEWEHKRSSVRAFPWRRPIGLTLPSPAAFHTVCFTTKHTWLPARFAARSIAYKRGGGETKERNSNYQYDINIG